jgi:flagellin
MAIRVNTNTTAQTSLAKLNNNTRRLSATFTRLSSGLRINTAADDSAGLAMAEQFDARVRSGYQAIRNINDGISAIQIAEGATNEIAEIIKRMRELAVQGASDLFTGVERGFLTTEYEQLRQEIDRIASVTEFNGLQLLSATAVARDVQVGILSSPDSVIQILAQPSTATDLGVDALSYATHTDARAAIATLDTALGTLSTIRANFGSVQNRLSSTMRSMETYTTAAGEAESRIRDADFARETAEMTKFNILQQAGMAVLGQATQMHQGVVRLLG